MKAAIFIASALVFSLFCSAEGRAQGPVNDYAGPVALESPGGGVTFYWFYMRLDPTGYVYFDASGAISGGEWYRIDQDTFLIIVRNRPHFSVFLIERPFEFGLRTDIPDYVIPYFSDSWGNSIWSSALFSVD